MKIEKVSAKFEKATVSSSGRYGGTNYLIKVKEINGWYAVYPLDMNIYGERYQVGFITKEEIVYWL